MMNPWIRLYRDSLHNPKIVSLNDRQHRAWHNLLLIAGDDGKLPPMRNVACHLRMTIQEAETTVCELVEFDLVDADCLVANNMRFRMHDWSTHQYVSDNSTDRVRKFRNKNNDGANETAMKRFSNGDVTPSESDSDTDTDLVSSLPEKHAAKKKKQGLIHVCEGMRKDEEPELLKRNAEGLGLDVEALVEKTNKRNPNNRSSYFTKLCVTELRSKLPANTNEGLIRDALWGKGNALGQLFALLTGAIT